MKSIHPIQLGILQDLLFSESRKYSEMKPDDMEGSQFTFHLDKLIKDKYIDKGQDGSYSLTTKGKEYANRMDTQSTLMRRQVKSTNQLCAIRDHNGEREYLIYKRLKNPFYGHYGFPTHKFWYGDNVKEAASKGLFEETNLTGKARLIAIRHYRVYYKNQLVEDKMMYVQFFENPDGKLKDKKDGKFSWATEADIRKLEGPVLPELAETLEIINNPGEVRFFKEIDQHIDSF